MPDSLFYSFAGDSVTYLGFFGIFATGVLLFTVFRSYWNSPFRK